MSAVYDPHSFHSDGTPRRKYEIDDVEQKRLAFTAVVGLIAVNIVILVKNVLFGTTVANDWADGARASEQPTSRNNGILDSMAEDEGSTILGSEEADRSEEPIGDGKSGILRSASYVRDGGAGLASASFGGQAPLQLVPVANDNELLYGSRPGTIVTAFNRADGDTISNDGGDLSLPPDGDTDDEDDDDETPPTPRPNRAPIVSGPIVLAGLMANTSVVIAFADLLRNASDPDGDKLYAVNLKASAGKLQVLSEGRGWVFTPDANDTSSVKFTYSITDLRSTTAQTAELDLLVPDDDVIVGTEGDDRIVGTMDGDVIDALGGDDVIIGRAGDDVIYGGSGNDRIFGEDGDDLIYAGAGDDFVSGGRGNDVAFGGTGRDILFGDDGDDVLHGDEDEDVLSGGDGKDLLFGDAGDDRLMGDADNDLLDGGDGDDDLDGGDNDDTLIGSGGSDKLAGGTGDDLVRAAVDDGDDAIDGGDGSDTYDTTSTSAAMYVDLAAGIARSAETGDDTLTSIENVTTGSGADYVTGSDADNTIVTNAGDDTVATAAGDDAIIAVAGDGDDDYTGGDGRDTYDTTSTSAAMYVDLAAGIARSAETGDDTLTSIENVTTGSGADYVTGSDADNTICAGEGDDTVAAAAGDDTIIAVAGDGDDDYAGGDGSDTYDLSATSADAIVDLLAGFAESIETGADTLLGFENVFAGAGDDTITGDGSANVIAGGAGGDTIDAGGGDDTILATVGDDDDAYTGGAGSDVYDLSGTSADAIVDLLAGLATSDDTGSDSLFGIENVIGSSGNDILVANNERNVFEGGDGDDLFVFRSVATTGKGHGSRDKILDFTVGDRIDIRDISDDIFRDLQNAFDDPVMRRFVMIQGDFFAPGQMRLTYDVLDDENVTVLQGNIDDDFDVDFEIELSGRHELQYEDFRN